MNSNEATKNNYYNKNQKSNNQPKPLEVTAPSNDTKRKEEHPPTRSNEIAFNIQKNNKRSEQIQRE